MIMAIDLDDNLLFISRLSVKMLDTTLQDIWITALIVFAVINVPKAMWVTDNECIPSGNAVIINRFLGPKIIYRNSKIYKHKQLHPVTNSIFLGNKSVNSIYFQTYLFYTFKALKSMTPCRNIKRFWSIKSMFLQGVWGVCRLGHRNTHLL